MIGGLPADVTVRLQRTKVAERAEFKARCPGVPPFRATLKEGGLDAARRQLDKGLTELKDALPGLIVEDTELNDIFIQLHRLGRRILFTLFGPNAGIVQGLQEFWRRALPFGRDPNYPALVECVGNNNSMLPIELLPLFSIDPGPEITSPAEFIEACRAMVGFSCIVKRSLLSSPLRGSLSLAVAADGRTPIRYLYYEGLEGAKEELAWFSSCASRRVEIEGPYPNALPGAPTLAEQIFDPGLRVAGGRRPVPDQIQHFACHCDTLSADPLESEIELSGNGHEVRVTLGKIGEDLIELAARSTGRTSDLPLVVMNACGSARMRATNSISLPHLFLENGNRGFIGSEVDMPDDVAAAFSREFYQNFLLMRLPLGRSLLGARNSLLHTFHNPLGIAYSAYADPELRVRPIMEESLDVPAVA